MHLVVLLTIPRPLSDWACFVAHDTLGEDSCDVTRGAKLFDIQLTGLQAWGLEDACVGFGWYYSMVGGAAGYDDGEWMMMMMGVCGNDDDDDMIGVCRNDDDGLWHCALTTQSMCI